MNAKAFIAVAFLFSFHFGAGQHIDALKIPEINSSRLVDSVVQALPDYTDSVRSISKIDSIRKATNYKLDSGVAVLNKLIDSLNAIANSPRQYQFGLYALYEKFDSTFFAPVKAKGDSINNEFRQRIKKMEGAIEKKKSFSDSLLTINEFCALDDLKLNAKLPDLGFDAVDLPSVPIDPLNLPAISTLNSPVTDLDFPNLSNLVGLGEIGKSMDKVGAITGDLGEYTEELGKAAHGDLANMEKIKERFEKQLLDMKEMRALKESSSAVSKLEKQIDGVTDKMKDKEKMKEEVVKTSKKQFEDYFAGHEDKIDSEIKSMEKLQRKYHSVTDVRYLPKKRTNPEKGKPFVERLIIGTGFQIDRKDPKWTGMDISPYIGYRFSDRLRMSAGGTYRVTFDTKTFEFFQQNKVFGYRTFANYRIFNGWFGHLEAETLKMQVPPAYSQPSFREESQWIPMAYVGLFKTFSISRHFQGQTQILYNFLDVDENFNFNKFAFRFGFEYKIIKKKKG